MTSPTLISWSPGFLSKSMSLMAKKASREPVWLDSTHNFFAKLARTIHMWMELWLKVLNVSILLQPSASLPEGPHPSLVRRTVFGMTSASTHSYFILCLDCGISSNKNCLCFCFKMRGGGRERRVSFRGNKLFSMLFERRFMALLMLSLFMCSTNFLDSCAIDFGLVESFNPFWIVSVSLNSRNKWLNYHRIILHRSASEWSFTFDLRLGFCNIRDDITIIAWNVIYFIAESCIHVFNNRVISSI